MKELYGEEWLELLELADLLEHPEKYGVTIDLGSNPKAQLIIKTAIADIRGLDGRPYPVGKGQWLAEKVPPSQT